MERKISTSLYALAFILTVIVFSAGVFVGTLFDQNNQELISDEVVDISSKLESTQLLMLLDENSSAFCPIYMSQLDSINDEVEKIGHKLAFLEDEKNVVDVPLKKSYFVLEAQSYLLSKKLNSRCGENNTLLLYFYSNVNCIECGQMGNEILSARDTISNGANTIKIYSFDGELGSPVADALKAQYGVHTYPSIVVNGELFSGYMDQSEIKAVLEGG
jgi:hypothetical protein